MSPQERKIAALEKHVGDLTQDCYYLLSLISTDGGFEVKDWPEGQKIIKDLERSTDFFQEKNKKELNALRAKKEEEERKAAAKRKEMLHELKNLKDLQEINNQNAARLAERIKRLESSIRE